MNRIGGEIGGNVIALLQDPQQPVTEAGGFLDARRSQGRGRHFSYGNLITEP